jgi:hypothetical protein
MNSAKGPNANLGAEKPTRAKQSCRTRVTRNCEARKPNGNKIALFANVGCQLGLFKRELVEVVLDSTSFRMSMTTVTMKLSRTMTTRAMMAANLVDE